MMRVSYVPPGVIHFDSVFSPHNVTGGALSDINVLKPHYYHNQGGSLFGILGNIVRRTIPFLANYVLPEAGNFARNIASEYGNIPIRKNLKQNFVKSVKNIGKRIMTGGSKVRKSVKGVMRGGVVKKKPVVKKKKKIQCKDVFSYKNLNI